jgi:uncharacterized protein (UPF0332 family)
MTGDEFLQLATKLFAASRANPSEALCRSVVNRAYYGAFHLAKDFLDNLGYPSSGHGLPPNWLSGSGEESAIRAGQLLADLYSERRRADYELHDPKVIARFRDRELVESLLEVAKEIQSLLMKCASEPTRSGVKKGIAEHKQRNGR